jgi:long-chain fatty acid transport protein
VKKNILLFLIVFSSITLVNAGGFQVNLQGQKQAGMGHTGTGLLQDNSCIFFNPGAMSFLDSLRGISFGTSLIFPRTIFLEPYPGTYTTTTVNHVSTPITLYATYKVGKTDKVTIGLGIYNPFGSRLQWDDDWKGQFLIREIDLKTFFIQPTVSYKLNDKVGIGAGFVYGTGNFSLRKGVPTQDSTGNYGEGELAGKANGFGFNAGIYIKASEKLSIGIDYRSQVNVKVKSGDAVFTVPTGLAEYFPSTNFSTQLRLPQVASLGLGYVVNEKLKLALDINFVGWQSYDSLIIDFEENTDKLKDIHSARMYDNSFIFRVGAQYKVNKNWSLRMGTYYDMSPVQDGYFTPETPDVNKIGITSGASVKLTKKINLDLSLLFIEGLKRTDTNIETGFGGTYKSRAIVPGFSFEYRF